MKITAILCTYNRSQSLAKALDSLAASKVHSSAEWEVLVVDNNSSDRTSEVCEEFGRRHPGRFRYVFEGQPGKSHALNTGIREARGDILAFVDDDVTVDSNWLQNLTSPLVQGNCVGVGGRVVPERDVVLPDWLRLDDPYTMGPLVMFDLGPKAGPLDEAPFGTNMAFKKNLFERYGGFRTDLGPQPGSEIRGEDSEFVCRLMSAGEPLRYQPSAVVYHSISPNRLRKEYFLAWWFDKGRSDIRTLENVMKSKWSLAGVPLVLVRRLLVWMLKWVLAPVSVRGFVAKVTVWYLAGEITECHRQRGQRASKVDDVRNYSQATKSGDVGLAASPLTTGRSHGQR